MAWCTKVYQSQLNLINTQWNNSGGSNLEIEPLRVRKIEETLMFFLQIGVLNGNIIF